MAYSELLRASVFLTAAGATVLAAIAVIGIQGDPTSLILAVAAVWWLGAAGIGLTLGREDRVSEGVRRTLAEARTISPSSAGPALAQPGRVALGRLGPIFVAVALAGGLGVLFPEVAVVAAGYALLVALAWRNREAAVLAIEGRDGVRFLIQSGPSFGPVRLIRSPGFTTF
jgi:hypothetical protein